MSGKIDWDPIRNLAQRVLKHGEPWELTEDIRSLLLRSAREVVIPRQDAEDALRHVTTATMLLKEIARRISEGSDRIGNALLRMYDLLDKGDLDGARQQMRDVLAVEIVPLYREIAEGELEKLDDLQ
jgi:DUSAM domain-containing protein